MRARHAHPEPVRDDGDRGGMLLPVDRPAAHVATGRWGEPWPGTRSASPRPAANLGHASGEAQAQIGEIQVRSEYLPDGYHGRPWDNEELRRTADGSAPETSVGSTPRVTCRSPDARRSWSSWAGSTCSRPRSRASCSPIRAIEQAAVVGRPHPSLGEALRRVRGRCRRRRRSSREKWSASRGRGSPATRCRTRSRSCPELPLLASGKPDRRALHDLQASSPAVAARRCSVDRPRPSWRAVRCSAGLAAAELERGRGRRRRPRTSEPGEPLCTAGERAATAAGSSPRAWSTCWRGAAAGGEVYVARQRKGATVGEVAVILGEPYAETVVASIPTTTLELERRPAAEAGAAVPQDPRQRAAHGRTGTGHARARTRRARAGRDGGGRRRPVAGRRAGPAARHRADGQSPVGDRARPRPLVRRRGDRGRSISISAHATVLLPAELDAATHRRCCRREADRVVALVGTAEEAAQLQCACARAPRPGRGRGRAGRR